jgi:hypothetical protein
MAELTSDQLTDLRGDIGDTGDPPAFTDTELQRLFTRAEEDYDTTVLLALRQLLGNAIKLADYTQNASQEKRSQVFSHLKSMVAYWEGIVDTGSTQVKFVGRRRVPPVYKRKPRA